MCSGILSLFFNTEALAWRVNEWGARGDNKRADRPGRRGEKWALGDRVWGGGRARTMTVGKGLWNTEKRTLGFESPISELTKSNPLNVQPGKLVFMFAFYYKCDTYTCRNFSRHKQCKAK